VPSAAVLLLERLVAVGEEAVELGPGATAATPASLSLAVAGRRVTPAPPPLATVSARRSGPRRPPQEIGRERSGEEGEGTGGEGREK
jgi:hypothetical protein